MYDSTSLTGETVWDRKTNKHDFSCLKSVLGINKVFYSLNGKKCGLELHDI